ncbi:hypothetical protein FNO01nite_26310 [Flavobacterium noncentrifugens]|uniref:Uncharacterized protein n=1 Tax=Flavobacterium noncentrifugens TaxID=1128970 RepID=A0A1G8ZFH9_9FLAO|nr:hypothetical protein [Flavobacterium noncentrifugens]GEP51959.1 hypothetical protein FNO01nite_26310 [Flavobacterium noncentrifugens]SDK13768.1 hypothetical protein SAMN04487935_2568 [Flavobacterium noncentrifugens]
MDRVITWGSIGDQVKYNLFDIKMGILPSERVGLEKTNIKEVFDPYYHSKTKEDVTDAIKAYQQVFPQRNPSKGKDTPSALDRAFLSDFGISFDRICEFIEGLAIIGIQQTTSFSFLDIKQLKTEINKVITPFDDSEFDNAVNYLTLFKRGKIEKIPEGYESFDISPWRFNRRLSLLRKPIVAFENVADKKNPIMYWGFRQVLSSRIYLADQITSGRLKVSESGQVIKAMGKLAQERGDSLVSKIFKKLQSKDLIIDTEVEINTKSQLLADKDLGDIDILVIDKSKNIIYSLECKSMSPSRNIKEMVEELNKLFEDRWIDKHVVRDTWIKNNLNLLGAKYKIDLTGFLVKSIFVTQEDMLTPYLKKGVLPIPFVTSYEIEENGINTFDLL